MEREKIWLVSDPIPARSLLRALSEAGHEVVAQTDLLEDMVDEAEDIEADLLIISRHTSGDISLKDALWKIRKQRPSMRIIVLMGKHDREVPRLRQSLAAMSIFDMVEGDALDEIAQAMVYSIRHPSSFSEVVKATQTPPSEAFIWDPDDDEPVDEDEETDKETRPRAGIIPNLFSVVSHRRRLTWKEDTAKEEGEEQPNIPMTPKRLEPSAPAFVVGRTIVFFGLQGGVGVSSLTSLVARHFDRMSLRVGVIEAARSGGQLLRYFGHHPVDRGAESTDPFSDALVHSGKNISLFPFGFGEAAIKPPNTTKLVMFLKRTCDLILVDGGSDLSWPAMRDAKEISDLIVPIMEPSEYGLYEGARFLEMMESTQEVAKVPGIVLNKRMAKKPSTSEVAEKLGTVVLADIQLNPKDFWFLQSSGGVNDGIMVDTSPLSKELLSRKEALAQ